MKLEIDTPSYNQRRYGKPYIAKIDFSTGASGTPTWGEWCGRAGDPGLLILEAEVGDIIMQGQKDNRNQRYSTPDYYQLADDGSLKPTGTKASAYKLWRDRQ